MALPATQSVMINDFLGLVNNVDPRNLPPGAAEVQTNCTCVKNGELQVRLGLRELTYDSEP